MQDGQGYDGYFVNNKFEGQGKLQFPPDDETRKAYIGGFKNGLFHGSGQIKLKNGDSYQTKWHDGKMEEHGIYTWENGDKARFTYDPVAENFIFSDSRVVFPESDFKLEYRGELKEGHIMHGLGTLTLRCNMTYTGNWENGESKEYKLELLGIEQGQIFKEEARLAKLKAETQSNKTASEVEAFSFKRENSPEEWLQSLKVAEINIRAQEAKNPPEILNKQQWFELSQVRALCLKEFYDLKMKEKVDECLSYSKLNDTVSYAAMLEILGETDKLNHQLVFTSKKFPIGFVNQLKILGRDELV